MQDRPLTPVAHPAAGAPSAESALAASVLRTLAYFAVFRHPLTAPEVFESCDEPGARPTPVREALAALVRRGCVRQEGAYYALADAESRAADAVDARRQAESRCEQMIPLAYRYSRLIARCPFVRGVCVSGSLSKGVAEADADVDYFIVTAPGRLWVCRTLLTLFKKTVLLNSHRYFCLNYFVDQDHLAIPNRNRYTATELAFLLPTYDYATYVALRQANAWVGDYLPHQLLRPAGAVAGRTDSWLKRGAETLLAGGAGEWLEARCRALTCAYRRRRFAYLSDEEFGHAMRATQGVATHHPRSFQNRVLRAYEERLAALRQRFGFPLL